jgi:Ca2+-binding RTX toxin-like protein
LDSPAPIRIYNGDQRAKLIGSEIDLTVPPTNPSFNTYKWSATSWAADGTLTGGVAEENFNDVIVGSGEADGINGLGGNDTLDGGGDDLSSVNGNTAGEGELADGAGDEWINKEWRMAA